jgi:hypothetical protein
VGFLFFEIENTMDIFWKIWGIIGVVVLGIMIYGIQRGGEIDYLEEKKVRDYTLKDISTVLFVLLLIIGFIMGLVSLFH